MQTSYGRINDQALRALSPPGSGYYVLLLLLALGIGGLFCAWLYQIFLGLGKTGIHHPVNWGVYIANFIFWVGIAHSGTMISAILYLLRARWRDAVSRAAEAMTVIAIMIAGLFPLIHLGRVWVFYYILPYPTERNIYPNFVSPLVWDVLAIATYLIVSTIFFLVGLIPDAAAARDRYEQQEEQHPVMALFYRVLALGWTGSGRQWQHYERAYLFFAAMATPLVVSVHSIVSWDFAVGLPAGWHTTIFAPYFVAGAIHSGLAMVLFLVIPLRRILRMEELIRDHHLEMVGLTLLVTTAIMAYSYVVEPFIAWYSGDIFERQFIAWRATEWYALVYWALIPLNVLVPCLLAVRRLRRSHLFLMFAAVNILVGMYLERYMLVTASLSHDFMPHTWSSYLPNWVELTITAGSFAMFFFLFLIFARTLPVVPMADLKALQAEKPAPEGEASPLTGSVAPASGDGSGLLAVYEDAGGLAAAVHRARAAGFNRLETFTPTRSASLLEAMGRGRSPIRYFTLAGAVLGGLLGFWLAWGTAGANNLYVGGKGPEAYIPFMIPAFEGFILIGALVNLGALIVFGGLGRFRTPRIYEHRFSRDRFALFVECPEGKREEAGALLSNTGPEEVHER
jgi:molybdopterin-containing oxidoreductase family membrane subunit